MVNQSCSIFMRAFEEVSQLSTGTCHVRHTCLHCPVHTSLAAADGEAAQVGGNRARASGASTRRKPASPQVEGHRHDEAAPKPSQQVWLCLLNSDL